MIINETESRVKRINVSKVIFFGFAAVYFVYCAADRQGFHFFDNVDLAIHEAGHVFFSPLGQFLTVAGGSIFQLIVPAVFVAYFLLRQDLYLFSSAVVSFWLGQSFINVARYAGDAVLMQLPLLGSGEHDWHYLLAQTNMLAQTAQIANFLYYCGIAIILIGIAAGAKSFIVSQDKNKMSEIKSI